MTLITLPLEGSLATHSMQIVKFRHDVGDIAPNLSGNSNPCGVAQHYRPPMKDTENSLVPMCSLFEWFDNHQFRVLNANKGSLFGLRRLLTVPHVDCASMFAFSYLSDEHKVNGDTMLRFLASLSYTTRTVWPGFITQSLTPIFSVGP